MEHFVQTGYHLRMDINPAQMRILLDALFVYREQPTTPIHDPDCLFWDRRITSDDQKMARDMMDCLRTTKNLYDRMTEDGKNPFLKLPVVISSPTPILPNNKQQGEPYDH